jgi:hypothetical protein
VRGVFGQIHDFNPKGTQGLKPPESEAGQPIFVLDEEDIKVVLTQEGMELGTIIIHAAPDLLDNVDDLPAFRFGISAKAIGLGC